MLLLSFAALLTVGVLLTERAHRTVLSTAVIFLVGGFVLGSGVTDVILVKPTDPEVRYLAELALFSVLFSDGMRVGWKDLRSTWRAPGRALLLGMPLAFGITAVLAHLLVGLPWLESLLLAAVLAPTDPVFASAIVGRSEVPARLRHVLNVESGVNDGLALPVVLVLLSMAGGTDTTGWTLAEELLLGVVIGVAVPWIVLWLERLPFLEATQRMEPLVTVSIGLLVLGIAHTTHANLFLAAFAAGVTVATVSPEFREEFERFGELVSELLKLAAILVFGALITPSFLFEEISAWGWLLAVLILVVPRPAALAVSFLGSQLGRRERLAAMWFGPKGFASVVYGLLVLESDIDRADQIFHLVALVIVLSILAHSSTDVLVASRFESPGDSGELRTDEDASPDAEPAAHRSRVEEP